MTMSYACKADEDPEEGSESEPPMPIGRMKAKRIRKENAARESASLDPVDSKANELEAKLGHSEDIRGRHESASVWPPILIEIYTLKNSRLRRCRESPVESLYQRNC